MQQRPRDIHELLAKERGTRPAFISPAAIIAGLAIVGANVTLVALAGPGWGPMAVGLLWGPALNGFLLFVGLHILPYLRQEHPDLRLGGFAATCIVLPLVFIALELANMGSR